MRHEASEDGGAGGQAEPSFAGRPMASSIAALQNEGITQPWLEMLLGETNIDPCLDQSVSGMASSHDVPTLRSTFRLCF